MAVTTQLEEGCLETPKTCLPTKLTNGHGGAHGISSVKGVHKNDLLNGENSFFLQANGDFTATPSHNDSRDVAIVGMACRVAGGNNSPTQLWQSLLDRKDASGEMPPERWEPYHRRDPRNTKVLNETSSRGYYLDHLEDFDAQFFGISPMEADQMDPQQRISLEVAWEALENAGIRPRDLSGSDTAVFWGINSTDYSHLILEDMPNIEAWMGIGTASCGAPNRISYHLNLLGPSSAVDAACASSLVAVHHGVQSILTGESEMAIVGGANALCGPGLFRALDRAGALSSDGCCRSFDDAACGYARGEGAAAVILKSVSRAIRDQDNILAVIKGTAVGHDGKTNGIMAPNAQAQALVARRALKVANIDPKSVGYVEAHATSTPLGDPTELSALASVYGVGRKDDPCLIGSIKPNIGHLEAGAGVIGLIKAVLAVRKGVIPPQANLQNLTKRFAWDDSGLEVVQEVQGWPNTANIRRAAISSYGYGGTVSHAVIEEFVPPQRVNSQAIDLNTSRPKTSTRPFTLLLSGRQEKRIVSQARALREWLESNKHGHSLASVASTLALRRDHHDYRAAVVVQDHEEAVQALTHLSEKKNHPWITQCRVVESHVNKDIVWVFSGHGAQWQDMGKELLSVPAFYHAVKPLDHIVAQEIGISPIALLRDCNFESSAHVQILTYIMQIGISAVLSSLGIFPKAIIGHSVGEIAASVVAGALTPEEGAIIVTRRAVLYGKVVGQGAMVLVNESFRNTAEKLADRTDVVAAIDTSPSSCVISGSVEAVTQVAEEFKKHGVKVFRVKTDIAFHSPMLKVLEDPLTAALSDSILPAHPSGAKLYSTCLNDPRGQDLRDQRYWTDNMVSPVRLTSAVKAALDDGYRIFMEISSHPIVSHSINETIIDADVTEGLVIPTLMRDKPTQKSILHTFSHLHCLGIPVDWKRQTIDAWATDLPNAPWIHRPAGRKIETAPMNTAQMHKVESNTLLGGRVPVAGTDTVLYATKLDETSKPFPLSHPVHGTEIIPAACLLHTFFKATGSSLLENIILRVPLATVAPRAVQIVKERNGVKVMSQLIQEDQGTVENSSSWVTHTTARWESISLQSRANEQHVDIQSTKADIQTRLANDFTIDYLAKVGVSAMGFPWEIQEHFGNTQEMLARVNINGSDASKCNFSSDPDSWAPLLDAATSVGSTIFFDEPRLRMPAQVQRAEIFNTDNPPTNCWLHVQKASESPYTSHISLLDDAGRILAKLTAMRFSEIEGAPDGASSMESLVHQISWVNVEPAKQPLPINNVVVLSDNASLREKYAGTVPKNIETVQVSSVRDLAAHHKTKPIEKGTVIVYMPNEATSMQDVATVTQISSWNLLELLNFSVKNSLPTKIFVLTHNVGEAEGSTALAHSSLYGLSRVLASEHFDHFGSLIDSDEQSIPVSCIQHSQGIDIIRIRNGQATAARLQSLPHNRLLPSTQTPHLMPRPEGTYLITGGLGALGLQVAAFLVTKGARRLVLISRRSLPPRTSWPTTTDPEMRDIVKQIQNLEAHGASIHVLPIDISTPTSAQILTASLHNLNLPPVLGVIHAAGVLDNQLALDTTPDAFAQVLDPKVTGGLVLHTVFPPGTLDFFILFSSCGQLVGFTGQSSYGTANAFLDGLATHRRGLGDKGAIAIQWTSWRGLGMASSTEYINAELASKGISDVTSDEAFAAWCHLSKYDTDHAVVLRSLVFEEGEEVPSSILNDIAVRRLPSNSSGSGTDNVDSGTAATADVRALSTTLSTQEFKAYLLARISECVAQILHMDAGEIDHRAALSDLGIDSVMTVSVRRLLQQTLKVKMPPTLTWTHPTVGHLVGWFVEKLRAE